MNQGFYDEVTRRLHKAGFTTQFVDSEGFLPVEWQGCPLCKVTPSGGVRYDGSKMKGESYAAAQRDFATRSGLVQVERLFSDQQLAIIYDACQTAQVYSSPANPEHEKLLECVIGQIEKALPDVIDLANTLTQEPKVGQEHQSRGMEMCGFS